MKLASQLRMQKYDVGDFLMKSNTFNRPKEEVEMIHEAIESPGKHSAYLKSFGLINYEEIKN